MKTPVWKPIDAINLADFIHKKSSLISQLESQKPSVRINTNSTMEGTAIAGAYKEGYELCIKHIHELTNPESPEEEKTQYTSM